jgi:hypothetical protein
MFGRSNPANEHLRLLEDEERDDVVADFGRRGRGEGGDGWPAPRAIARLALRGGFSQTPVIRTEIVTPLRNAVCLVDDEPRDRQFAEEPQELTGREPFGRHIQQPQAPGAGSAQHAVPAVGGQHRMQRAGPNSAAVQLVDLILHQRDERRDHERRARQHDRRQLIGERLARAGRHHGEHVVSAEDSLDDLLLPVPVFPVSEVRAQLPQRLGPQLLRHAHRRRRWHRRRWIFKGWTGLSAHGFRVTVLSPNECWAPIECWVLRAGC